MNNTEEENSKINSEKAQEIKVATRTSLFQRLAARFGFVVHKKTLENGHILKKKEIKSTYKLIKKPTEQQLLNKNSKEELELINKLTSDSSMSTTVSDLFQDWAEDTQITYANIAEREERLNALTYMCDNEGIVKTAVTLVASETASLSENCAFTVISEDKEWQDEINYTLDKIWKLNQPVIYSLAWNIFLYGEAFLGREISSAGIVNLNLIGVNEIAERLEFKASKVVEFKMQMQAGSGGQSTGFTANLTMPTSNSFASSNLNFNFSNKNKITYTSTDELLKDYIENLSDISADEYFTSHLLGYRVFNDQLVAPWQVSHFRFNAGVSEFWPYGQPPLLACLAAYKQLQRVMGLDDLEKLLSLPIHLYKVKTNGATYGRAFDIVNDVKERFENVGLIAGAAGLEGPSLATNIWTSDDLLSVETVETKGASDSGATDKMKFFNARLSTATGIPMSYIDPSAEGFQMSGVALSTLFKPFRTLIENIRGIIIAEIEDTIRLHDSIRNRETPDFALTMNVISPVDTEDISSKLQLSSTVMETIAQFLELEDAASLPKGVKKDILLKYVGIPVSELENYESILEDEGESNTEVSEEAVESDFGDLPSDNDSFDTDTSDTDTDTGTSEDFEESLKRRKGRLIQERYQELKNAIDLKFYLVEKLSKYQTSTGTSVFCNSGSKMCQEMTSFLRKNLHTRKRHGKRRISEQKRRVEEIEDPTTL